MAFRSIRSISPWMNFYTLFSNKSNSKIGEIRRFYGVMKLILGDRKLFKEKYLIYEWKNFVLDFVELEISHIFRGYIPNQTLISIKHGSLGRCLFPSLNTKPIELLGNSWSNCACMKTGDRLYNSQLSSFLKLFSIFYSLVHLSSCSNVPTMDPHSSYSHTQRTFFYFIRKSRTWNP